MIARTPSATARPTARATTGFAAGGGDAGAPGLRPQYHAAHYAAFLEDPEGNRLEALWHKWD